MRMTCNIGMIESLPYALTTHRTLTAYDVAELVYRSLDRENELVHYVVDDDGDVVRIGSEAIDFE